MSIAKKLAISLSIFATVLVALVVGVICYNVNTSTTKLPIGASYNVEDGKPSKPSTITYAPNTISIKKGGNTLNFSYSMDGNQTGEKAIAYEYKFRNIMDRASGVNLKSIDTTGVEVSYIYSDTRIDTTKTLTGETTYTLQNLAVKGSAGDSKYIYVIVSPINEEIPTTFTTSIVWYYGIPKQVTIQDNLGNISQQTIISGQSASTINMQAPASEIVKDAEGNDVEIPYYIDGYFSDKECTQLISTQDVKVNQQQVYVRYANLPTDYLEVYGSGSSAYARVKKGTSPLPTNLVIPSTFNGYNVTQIYSIGTSNSPFYNNTSLLSVNLPTTLTSMGSNTFQGCGSLVNINIPDGVTGVGLYVFTYCKNLNTISIPSSVRNIGYQAFYGAGLTNINIPNSVTSIGASAFYYCTRLTTITFGANSNLTSIESDAFRCSGLNSITIPRSVTSIGSKAIYDCSKLSNIVVETGNAVYDSRNNCNALIETSTNTLIQGCNTTIIPNGIEIIAEGAFYNCKEITSITIPEGVTSIGSSAFNSCYNLTSINIPDGVTGIDSQAFDSSAITNIIIPASVTSIGNYAFRYCRSLTSVTFEENSKLTSIGNQVFNDCKLTSITIPSSVTTIGSNAFQSCSKLTSITFEADEGEDLTNCWYKSTASTYTDWNEADILDLSNATQNATYFKSTYKSSYWYKKVS